MAVTYKDLIASSMTMLGHHPRTFVVGYNVTKIGGFGGGTFNEFPQLRMVECPLAEESMAGIAIGMSLDGWIPILWLERMDFLTNCLDPIVNHLDKMELLSSGTHKPSVIIRCAVGNRNIPLYTGPTHTQDFSKAIREMARLTVVNLHWPSSIVSDYAKALERAENGQSSLMVEYRDHYQNT